MKTISLKLPDSLHAELQRAAKCGRRSKSDVMRTALEQYLHGERTAALPGSLLERAGKLIGCLKGPGDLSYNKKHMEGFGQ